MASRRTYRETLAPGYSDLINLISMTTPMVNPLPPLQAEHDDVDAGADAEQGYAVARLNVAAFDAQRCRRRQGRGAGVAEILERGEVDALIEPERLEQQTMMGAADLMAKRLLDVAGLPFHFFEKRGKRRLRGRDALAHQRFGIGGHQDGRMRWRETFTALTPGPSPGMGEGRAATLAALAQVRNARWRFA